LDLCSCYLERCLYMRSKIRSYLQSLYNNLGVISAMMGLNLLNKYYVKAYTKGVGSLTLSSNSENSGENDVD